MSDDAAPKDLSSLIKAPPPLTARWRAPGVPSTHPGQGDRDRLLVQATHELKRDTEGKAQQEAEEVS